ncbi:hypothetical protein D3C72_2325340 [compost metagenome]
MDRRFRLLVLPVLVSPVLAFSVPASSLAFLAQVWQVPVSQESASALLALV